VKLHLITRADLPLGQQAVQIVHAMREFVREHPDEDHEWYRKSNTLAFLEVEDEKALTALLSAARLRRIACSGFREPDRDDELTAIAIGPQGKGLCRRLRLAMSEVDACEAITCTPTIVAKTSIELNTTTDGLAGLPGL
jgi:peptidyl-tRNA hydrolase